MAAFTNARNRDTDDELWLLQHYPVFTFGQAGKPEHLLDPHHVPVVQSDRGGQVTYHGPGQLIAYPLLNLQRLHLGVRDFVIRIEQVIINCLTDFGIVAERRHRAPGVYVNNAKIASLGLRVRRGYTLHGLSVNVAMDLQPFGWINPCGYAGLAVTQIADCFAEGGDAPALDQVSATLLHHFCQQFPFILVEPK